MNRIFGIDIFRGLAALLVLCFHYWTFFPDSSFFQISWIQTVFSAGHLGVDMFFVLSGFLVSLSLFYTPKISRYAKKRIVRIVPLAWAVVLGLFLYKHDFSTEKFLDFFVHFFFLQGFFSEWYHSINPVMWTLSVEMLFYALLPILYVFVARRNFQKFLGISFLLVCLSFAWRAYVFYTFPESSAAEKIFLSEQLWGRFDQFFLGMVLAVLVFTQQKKQKFLEISGILKISILLSGLLIFASSYFVFAQLASDFREILWMQVFLHSLVGLGFFLFLLAFVQFTVPQKIQKFLTPFLFLGEISYGMYLFHFPLLSLSSKIPVLSQNPEISFFLILGITVFLSWLSYEFFEKRFLRR